MDHSPGSQYLYRKIRVKIFRIIEINIVTVGTDSPVIACSVGPLEDTLLTGDMLREMDIDQSHPSNVVTDVIFLRPGLPCLQSKPETPTTISHTVASQPAVIIPVETVLQIYMLKGNISD